ncbi:hypothetical protein PDE_08224 [Penicillium oxalicum 114-2]|uniref:Uncharacterized protein n=1 Tax=Penicillium oxalicum (strain 114-2 / CGMCC 5302) TaxID=933388 RepID=S8BDZ5_PENO1|nr:hypothetical protein PDE_08224 [Penicillium oxalicum 114-2]
MPDSITDEKSVINDEQWHEPLRADISLPDNDAQRSNATMGRRSWSNRLQALSQILDHATDSDEPTPECDRIVQAHLDALESIFRNPRRELTGENSGQSPPVPGNGIWKDSTDQDATIQTTVSMQTGRHDHTATLAHLTHLLSELTLLNAEVERRRNEAREIRERYEERCRGLTRNVAELEEEISELHSDLIEDAIDLECLQGTVKGLHEWTDRAHDEQERNRALRVDLTSYHSPRRSWMGRKDKGGRRDRDRDAEMDCEKILEGIAAWMRGWRDVEEEFQIRARARRTRRDQRQEHLIRAAEMSVSLGNESGHASSHSKSAPRSRVR